MRLTENFTLEELIRSEAAARYGVDNTPDTNTIENLKRLAWLLEKIRITVKRPVLVNSGYRCPAVNTLVGGSTKSQHMNGCAADIRVPGLSPSEVMDCIVSAGLPYDQLILEFDSWVHISVPNVATDYPRKQALVINKSGSYMYAAKTPPKVDAEVMKPLTKSRTVRSATVAATTGGGLATVGTIAAVAPAMPVASDVAYMAQNNPTGVLIIAGLAILAFAAYVLYLRIDDKRNHQ